MERGGGRAQNPSKSPKYSSMTHDESEDMFFQVSQLQGLVKGFVIKVELDNLKRDLEKSMEG